MRPIVEYSATVWDTYVVYKKIHQVELIQCRAARWVLGRYDRLDSVTDMLSALKRKSLELRRSDARLCMLCKQINGLATYEINVTSYRKNMRAEWTPSCRLSVIDLSSHVVHLIITRTLFTLKQLHSRTISHQKLLHLFRHFHLGNPCVTLHIDQ